MRAFRWDARVSMAICVAVVVGCLVVVSRVTRTAPTVQPRYQQSTEVRVDRLRKVLESQFEAEKTDSAWRVAVEAKIRSAIEGAVQTYLHDGRLISCSCRSSLCKVELVGLGPEQQASLPQLTLQAGLRLMAFRDDLVDSGSTTIFFVRPGTVIAEPN
jgi:hypothetical protein